MRDFPITLLTIGFVIGVLSGAALTTHAGAARADSDTASHLDRAEKRADAATLACHDDLIRMQDLATACERVAEHECTNVRIP